MPKKGTCLKLGPILSQSLVFSLHFPREEGFLVAVFSDIASEEEWGRGGVSRIAIHVTFRQIRGLRVL